MTLSMAPTSSSFPFLTIPDDDFMLNTQQIDLWQFPLEPRWKEAESWLNSDEMRRAQRYHFERHRHRFASARAQLRLILARYLNCSAKELTFHTNAYGKPYLLDNSHIQFNLSHSKNLALLAIGQQHPVGVDIEFFSTRPFTGISKLMFSRQETTEYAAINPRLRALAFFRVWAQKEAFIKATGMGLSYPTQSFDVAVRSSAELEIRDHQHAKTWYMRSFMPKIGCYAALCHDPAIQQIRYRVLTEANHGIK